MTDWADELRRCIRCGACREVCPVFLQTLLETDVARGRLARIERADQTGRFTTADCEALTLCLQCGKCTEICKAGVAVPDIVRDAKARAGCATALQDTALAFLGDGVAMERLTRRARTFAGWLTKTTPDGSGLRLRFALPYLQKSRYLPKPPDAPYLQNHAGRQADGEKPVALFLGCGAGWLLDQVGEAMDAILEQMNLTAAVPEQTCCGLPAWGIGDVKRAREAAINFLESFADYPAILSPCASCTAHLQQHLPLVLAGTVHEQAARKIADKVHDFFVWLHQQSWQPDLTERRVAVHVPCHTRRGVRGGDALNGLLRKAGAQIVALDESLEQSCCGMGGSFGVLHPKLSREIGLAKVRAMLAAEPDVITTSCTGCLVQLRDLVDLHQSHVQVVHAATLLNG